MRSVRWIGLLALAALVGCGSEESRYRLVSVTGTVTLNGKPLGDAKVNFAPLEGNEVNTPGVDVSGPAGNYKLMFKGRSGVAPGKYKVTVTPPDPSASGSVPEAFKDDPAMLGFEREARNLVQGKKKEDPNYKNEFEAEVPDDGGVLDFDVQTAPKAPDKAKAK
jgi:hypothetical protein